MKCDNLAHNFSITLSYECLDLPSGDCPYCMIDSLRVELSTLKEQREALVEALEGCVEFADNHGYAPAFATELLTKIKEQG